MARLPRSTVTEKGQVTIPKRMRERLGIRAGQQLEFAEHPGGGILARKVVAQDPVDDLYGILRLPGGTDELIQRMRGEPDAT
jgi:antitoxin PrlF